MSNILLKLTGDREDAKAVVDEQGAQLEEFGKKSYTAELRVDAEQAKREIAEVIAEAKAIPKEETIRIRVAAEQSKLQQLLARKQGLEGQLQSAAANGENTDGLVQRLGTYSQRIDAVRGRLESLGQDFEKLGQDGEQSVSRLTTGLTKTGGALTKLRTGLTSAVSGVLEKVPLIGGLFSKIAEGVGSLATTLLPEAATGITSFVSGFVGLISVGPILAVIVIAMGALVVSIGQALIGIVALGAAFLVVLGPIVALLGIVLVKIKDIVSGQVALKQANANLKSAIDAQKSAVTQLHQAETTQSNTRLAAIQAERQALLQLEDAQNGVADARLGIQSARLQLQQAQLTLRMFKQGLAGMGTSPGDLLGKSQDVSVGGNLGQTQQGSSPLAWLQMLLQYKQDILDVKTAAHGTVDAVQSLKDATNNQLTAQETWSQYLKRGLRAYQPYLQAVNAVVTAQQNLVRADDQLKSAELAKTLAIRHGASDASAFMKMWDKLKHTLGVIFGPAEKQVFKGIEEALGILAGKLKPLMPAFLALGQAIGGAFVWWAKMMVKPDNMKLIVGLVRDAAKWTTTMSHWLGSAFKFVIQIAEDAMPALIRIFTGWAKQLSGANTHTKSIKDFIDKCIGKATTFWHVLLKIGAALKTIAGFFGTLEKVFHVVGQIASTPGHIAASVLGTGTTPDVVPKASSSPTAILKALGLASAHQSLQNIRQAIYGMNYSGSQNAAIIAELRKTGQYNKYGKYQGPQPIDVTQHYHVPAGTDTDHFGRKMKKNLQSLGGGQR